MSNAYDPQAQYQAGLDILSNQAPATNDQQVAYKAIAPARTIATIAAELQASMEAAGRIKALREELHTALGRRPRGPRKAK